MCPRSWEVGLTSLILPHLSFTYLYIRGWPDASCMGRTENFLPKLFINLLFSPDATILAASGVARTLQLFIYLFPRPGESSRARPPPVDIPRYFYLLYLFPSSVRPRCAADPRTRRSRLFNSFSWDAMEIHSILSLKYHGEGGLVCFSFWVGGSPGAQPATKKV